MVIFFEVHLGAAQVACPPTDRAREQKLELFCKEDHDSEFKRSLRSLISRVEGS
jgi:hypothetical protein